MTRTQINTDVQRPAKPSRMENNLLRWLHEFLFSLNLSWIVIWLERGHPSWPLAVERSPYLLKLYGRLRLGEPPTILDQVIWSFLLAVLVFLLLRSAARLNVARLLLRTLAGVFALTAFPSFYLAFPSNAMGPFQSAPHALLLVIETFCALLCGILFYLELVTVPPIVYVGLALLHFSFWSWLTPNHVSLRGQICRYGMLTLGTWVSIAFYFGFPVIGFFSTIAWGLFVRKTQALAKQ